MARHALAGTSGTSTPLFASPDEDWRADARESRAAARANGEDADGRFLALDVEGESPFLRAEKRVPVRRGPVTRKTATRLRRSLTVVGIVAAFAVATGVAYRYALAAPRFRIDSSDQIEVDGAGNVSRRQVMEYFAGDLGRNVFYVPLDERKRQIEQLPWVESAAVLRLLPDHIRVAVSERTPVAFVAMGPRILLMDANGVAMEPRANSKTNYSFPVIVGMSEAEPLSTRAARMKLFSALEHELDSGGARYSEDISEVDLRDPDDVKVTVPDDSGAVLVHLGASDFQERLKLYKAHIRAWREQYQKIESVDLRFDKQVIVHPEAVHPDVPNQSAATPAVRPAALPLSSLPASRGARTFAVRPARRHAYQDHGKRAAAIVDGH